MAADREQGVCDPAASASVGELFEHAGGGDLLQVFAFGVADLFGAGVDRHAGLFDECRDRADVVEVGVGDEHGPNVGRSPPDLVDRVEDVGCVCGVSGVYHGDPATVVDERPVDVGAGYDMDGIGDLIDFHVGPTRGCRVR